MCEEVNKIQIRSSICFHGFYLFFCVVLFHKGALGIMGFRAFSTQNPVMHRRLILYIIDIAWIALSSYSETRKNTDRNDVMCFGLRMSRDRQFPACFLSKMNSILSRWWFSVLVNFSCTIRDHRIANEVFHVIKFTNGYKSNLSVV